MTSTNVESPKRRPRWIENAERLDLAIYAAIARTPTPSLDVAMSRLSRAADYSRLSLMSAAPLALTGGRTGRRAAAQGLASLGVTATVVNVAVKPLARRRRPEPLGALAALVAYSRVHTGVHYPADVLAGALIGTALAELTRTYWRAADPATQPATDGVKWAAPSWAPSWLRRPRRAERRCRRRTSTRVLFRAS